MEVHPAIGLHHSISFCSFVAGNLLAGHLPKLGAGEAQANTRDYQSLKMGRSWKRQIPISRGPSPRFSPTAIGSHTSTDTDDMFDDLFKKYGKVVYQRNDQKSATDEIDDDAESLSFAVAVAKVASDVKAADIRVLFVKPLVYWTRFFIIATAFSRPQIDAIGSKIRYMAEMQYGKVATGDSKPNSWTLFDFGDVVVHIFLPQQRAFYNLEEFYGNATLVELPFENPQQYRN